MQHRHWDADETRQNYASSVHNTKTNSFGFIRGFHRPIAIATVAMLCTVFELMPNFVWATNINVHYELNILASSWCVSVDVSSPFAMCECVRRTHCVLCVWWETDSNTTHTHTNARTQDATNDKSFLIISSSFRGRSFDTEYSNFFFVSSLRCPSSEIHNRSHTADR